MKDKKLWYFYAEDWSFWGFEYVTAEALKKEEDSIRNAGGTPQVANSPFRTFKEAKTAAALKFRNDILEIREIIGEILDSKASDYKNNLRYRNSL